MLERLKQAKALQAEADEAHKNFVTTREEAKKINERYMETLNKLKELKGVLRRAAEEERSKLEEKARRELEKKAREKLRRGERLTWEEFTVLTEKNLI